MLNFKVFLAFFYLSFKRKFYRCYIYIFLKEYKKHDSAHSDKY